MDSELNELAAHSLNSINAAPIDLPDLLDSLLLSQSRLNEKVTLCEQIANSLTNQVGPVRSHLAALNDANPQLSRRSVPISELNHQDDDYRIYRSQSLLLQHIINQLTFLSWKIGQDLKGQLDQLTTAHLRVFLDFLGYRHIHAENENPGPDDMQCVNGCDWYSTIGPFQWSKQPYSTAWWKEMNDTDWDWKRVREHISNIEVNTWRVSQSVDLLNKNVKFFVPAWLQYESPKMWALAAALVLPKDVSGNSGKSEVKLQVRFVKTEQMKVYERGLLIGHQRQKWIEEGMSRQEAEEKPVNVEVNAIGVQNLNWVTGFNRPATMQDWTRGGQWIHVNSWLQGLGFLKWLNSQARIKQEVCSMSRTTIKAE